MADAVDAILLVLGVGSLYFGSVWAMHGSDRIAAHFHLSPFVYSLTVLALITSLPEVLVNSAHALSGSYDVVADDVYGSVVFDVLFVLGLAATLQHLSSDRRRLAITVSLLLLTLVTLFVIARDLTITRLEGVLLVGWVVPVSLAFRLAHSEQRHSLNGSALPEGSPALAKNLSGRSSNEFFSLAAGIACLILAAYCVAEATLGLDAAASDITMLVDLGERVMGIAIVGISTSMPELLASMMGLKQGKHDLVFGLLVGSSTVNLALGFGVPSILVPDGIPIASDFVFLDIPFLALVCACALLPVVAPRPFDRLAGLGMVFAYVVFLVSVMVGASPIRFAAPVLMLSVACVGVAHLFHRGSHVSMD